MKNNLQTNIQQSYAAYCAAVKNAHGSIVGLIQASWDFGDLLTDQRLKLRDDAKFEQYATTNNINISDAWCCLKVRSMGTRDEVVTGNTMRQIMLTVVAPKPADNKEERKEICPPAHHWSIVKAFKGLQAKLQSNLVTIEREQVKQDLKPLYDWLSQFFRE